MWICAQVDYFLSISVPSLLHFSLLYSRATESERRVPGTAGTAAHRSWHGTLTQKAYVWGIVSADAGLPKGAPLRSPGFLISLEINLCTPSHLLWGVACCPYLEDMYESPGEGRVSLQQDCPEWLWPLPLWLNHHTVFSLWTTEKSMCPERETHFRTTFLKDKE